MRRAALILSAMLLPALLLPSEATAAPPAPPQDARGSVALYCAQECGEIVLNGFAMRTRLPRVAARPVVVLTDVSDSWTRPTAEELQAWGEGEVSGMDQAGQVVLLQWATPAAEALPSLEQVLGAAASTASWIEDVDTGRLLGPGPAASLAAASALDSPDLSALVVVEIHETDDGSSLLTRGLARLGLPELVERGVAQDELGPAAARLNAVAQAIFEGGLDTTVEVDATRFASDSAARAACELQGRATLIYGRGLSDLPGEGLRAELVSFEGAFGRCAEDEARPGTAAPPPPDELQRALAQAKTRLAGPVKAAFLAGLPPGDRLMVKAPFQDATGHVSWLWLGVERWSDENEISGPLLSDPPQALGIAKGQVVRAELDLVFDYLWRKADGSSEGNETQAFLD